MNRYLNNLIKLLVSSGLLTLVLIFNGGTANADDSTPQNTTLIVPDPIPSDTSTVTVSIQSVQDKISAAQTALSESASTNGQALLNTIQTNTGSDTQTAISIATTKEPIATAVLDASHKDEIAYQAIQSAQAAVDTATVAATNVTNQIIVVAQAQSSVDSATTTIQEKTTIVGTATINLSNAKTSLTTATQNVSNQQSVVDTATATVATNQINLNNATANVTTQQEVVATDTTTVSIKQADVDIKTATVATDTTNVATATQTKTTADAAVAANTQSGLNMTVKQDIGYNNAPPVFIGNTTLTTTVSQINQNWGSGGPANTYSDDFQVKYDGQIISTTTGNIQFYVPADDGVKLYLDNTLVINDWYDKGGGGSVSSPIAFTANTPKAITLYFYENGGGANVQLQWNKGNGWQVVPSSAFSRSSATQAQLDAAEAAATALNQANATLSTDTSALNAAKMALTAAQTQLSTDQATLTNLQADKITAQTTLTNSQGDLQTQQSTLNALIVVKNNAQSNVDAKTTILTNTKQDLTTANNNLTVTTATFTLEQQNLTNMQEIAIATLQTANTLADTATTAVQVASSAMANAVQITKDYYAEQKRLADEAAAKAAADALAAQQAAAAAAARAAASQQVPAQQPAANPSTNQGGTDQTQTTPQEPNATDSTSQTQPSDSNSSTDSSQSNTDAQNSQDASSQDTNSQTNDGQTDNSANGSSTDTQQGDTQQSATDQQQQTQPTSNQNQNQDTSSTPTSTSSIPSDPNQLPTDKPLIPSADLLVPRVQVDKPGVENGGIQFFGTQSQPQVIGEDGKLTPPPPPPGSGLPIPPDAITTKETFIGQPGGTTFNAPDIAVPVTMTYVCHTIIKDSGEKVHLDINNNEHPIEQCTFLPAALDAIPGAGQAIQALGAAYTTMANIGNDMSPITRKKAKKILVTTLVLGQIAGLRRRFG